MSGLVCPGGQSVGLLAVVSRLLLAGSSAGLLSTGQASIVAEGKSGATDYDDQISPGKDSVI